MAFVIDGNDSFNTRYVNNTPYPTDVGGNCGNEEVWTCGVLNRCGVALLGNDHIQGNLPFQHQDRFAFSPLPTNPLSLEGLTLFLLIREFAKTKEGLKSIERIALKYIETCGSIIEAVQDASHSNWLTALNNQHITAAITHRIGLMDDGSYAKIMDHYRSVFDKLYGLNIFVDTLGGVTTLVQGNKIKSQPTQYGITEETGGLVSLLSAVKGLK